MNHLMMSIFHFDLQICLSVAKYLIYFYPSTDFLPMSCDACLLIFWYVFIFGIFSFSFNHFILRTAIKYHLNAKHDNIIEVLLYMHAIMSHPYKNTPISIETISMCHIWGKKNVKNSCAINKHTIESN